MINIYKITDCNGLCYVGSTKSDIRRRLASHCYEKKKGNRSLLKLDLDNCEIEVLEVCDAKYKKEKIIYWTLFYNII